jgi:hypothetical protein
MFELEPDRAEHRVLAARRARVGSLPLTARLVAPVKWRDETRLFEGEEFDDGKFVAPPVRSYCL